MSSCFKIKAEIKSFTVCLFLRLKCSTFLNKLTSSLSFIPSVSFCLPNTRASIETSSDSAIFFTRYLLVKATGEIKDVGEENHRQQFFANGI